jgi:hypothetical protein
MLAQAKESRLYLSNQLMVDFNDPSNSDTSFTAVLGSIFECRRIVLGSAFIENYFINLNDLSLTLDGIFYDIKPQFFLTQSTLIAFLNDTVGGEHFSYGNTLPTYDTRLELVCDQLFSLQGLSWYR